MCIADYLLYIFKIIIIEKFDEEMNIYEMLKNLPALIQGYVILNLKESFKKLNFIRNKILFYISDYKFNFMEGLKDFYKVCEKKKKKSGATQIINNKI